MKNLTIGILAHVDAGKTTLSEGMLYLSGQIKKMGRVDHGDAFLDTYELEKERGITIFSKQAVLEYGQSHITLMDTPGHVDFSAEMERTLQILDYAVLVVSGSDGIQGHTETVMQLLKRYGIPVFLFVNKMDLPACNQPDFKETLLNGFRKKFGDGFVDFCGEEDAFYESVAMCGEAALEEYMESGKVGKEHIREMILERTLIPSFFGSALKLSGVEEVLKALDEYTKEPEKQEEFGAMVYKIARDEQGKRVTFLKVTGGTLKAKQVISYPDGEKEKTDQIRIYSGAKYKTTECAMPGEIAGVTGLTLTKAGMALGSHKEAGHPLLEPVLNYQILLPEGVDAHAFYGKLKTLEEEEPLLHLTYREQTGEISATVMGEIQIEILKSMIQERFGIEVSFGEGAIIYKETIEDAVEGVGHFEPLRHYAEVHLLLEPAERGSGLTFDCTCSVDELAGNWQRLILTHLQEKEHLGVLTGSQLTDVKITLITGRAHQKHTEGGDFRQATYRAVRQGLKQAHSILLEPYYAFEMELQTEYSGRAMTDLKRMYGEFEDPQIEGEMTKIRGKAPVSLMQGYTREFLSYTRGRGKLICRVCGYEKCHNEEEVLEKINYDSEADLENPTGSVFCAHGAGFVVPWNEVQNFMHLHPEIPGITKREEIAEEIPELSMQEKKQKHQDAYAMDKELEAIFERTFGPVKREVPQKQVITAKKTEKPYVAKWENKKPQKKYLLVDGYNLLFSWPELNELSKVNLDGARTKLMDLLCNYQGYKKMELILVFDAYKVKGNPGQALKYHNIHVIYTKEAQTADAYIEKTTHELAKKHDVTVVTSDGLEQLIIMGQGAKRVSSREFQEQISEMEKELRENYLS